MATSRVTEKGQVVIPAEIRRKYNIKKGTRVVVTETEGRAILVKPIPDDPIEASKGALKGKISLANALIEDRREEAARG